MEVAEFQKKLSDLCALAGENGQVLTTGQLKDTLAGTDLDKDQLLKVLSYLKLQGITIEGAVLPEEPEKGSGETADEAPEREQIPLTAQEQAYLEDYRSSLSAFHPSGSKTEELFLRLAGGSEEARNELAGRYMDTAAELAVEMNCQEISLADLIQEANVSLMSALRDCGETVRDDAWLRREIRNGIQKAIETQQDTRFADDALVAKVEKLESAVKELTEDEEENKFTVNELAILLDMDVEEIQDILRLTGDDK